MRFGPSPVCGFQRQVVHDLVGRKIGDLDDDLASELAELFRQMGIGLQRQKLHLVHRRRELVVPGAGLVDAGHEMSFDPGI